MKVSDNTLAVYTLVIGAVLAGIILNVKKVGGSGGDGHGHGHGQGESEEHGDEEGHDGEGVVEFDDDQIATSGIELKTAASSEVGGRLRLRGQISVSRDLHTAIAPRFAGTVQHIAKSLGDRVKRNELIAVIESNATRASFEVRSGIDGVVTDIRVGKGGFASDTEPVAVVTDLSKVWGEFMVPDRDAATIRVGQRVRVADSVSGQAVDARISFVSPIVDEDTQSTLVRVDIDNASGGWRPGAFVEGAIDKATTSAQVAVDRKALHELEGRQVVFVRTEDGFVPRPVETGAVGTDLVEVSSGIQAGDMYAAANSYVVKAEILKSSAEHTH